MENFIYGISASIIIYAALCFYAMHFWDGKISLPDRIMQIAAHIATIYWKFKPDSHVKRESIIKIKDILK